MNKVTNSKDVIAAQVKSNMRLMVGGFGMTGSPLALIDAIAETEIRGLTIISNNIGAQGEGLGRLLQQGQISTVIGSFFSGNPDVANYYNKKLIDVQLVPQGTLGERIRAAGAGIGGFYTKTSVGTLLAEGKETKVLDGETYLLELPLHADIALIRAKNADEYGNLTYDKTARNFNPLMAMAAKCVIAEVDQIVPVGELDPEQIVTPHLYVDYIVQVSGEGN